ncbi:tetratricopeptide repeat protein [Nocardia nova]|uniref:tetratricopeptide repeat protein n=1 Tax=Nocardia nova TaxID=37330 RepID=UPI0025B1B8C7|nr:tetratricopeptide repeat protein [Nocardia nova]MDN2495885.1 tetratricopeptide repeat protein [Nocardia nova]
MTQSDPGARAALAAGLTELRTQVGEPSFRRLASILAKVPEGGVSATTLRGAATADAPIPKSATVFQFVTACRLYAEQTHRTMDPGCFDLDSWYLRWKRIGGAAEDPAADEHVANLQSITTDVGRAEEVRAVVVGLVPRKPAHFIHREQLTALGDGLARGEGAVVVTGMRGAGKTQLAAAYARAVLDHESGLVGWVNAETAGTLFTGLAEIAHHIGVAAADGDPVKSAHRLRDYFNNHSDPHLLVLDNATDPDLLRTITPTRGGARVVITAADNAVRHLADVIVEAGTGYTPEQAREFLRAATAIIDDPYGEKALAVELGCLPLALAAAASTITAARPPLSYSVYLQRLRSQPLPSALRRRADADYPQSTDQAIMLSVHAAEASTGDRRLDAVVRWLLRLFAVLAPSGVSRELLRHRNPDMDVLVDDGIDHCVRHSLLSWSNEETSLLAHRLTARVLRERARDTESGDEILAEALSLLGMRLFGPDIAWAHRGEGAELVDHIEAVWASDLPARAHDSLRERAVQIRLWALNHLIDTASLTRAIAMGLQTVADAERILGPDHLYTLASRNDLASAYASARQFDEACPVFEQTVTDSKRILGPDHPKTLVARGNLAKAYRIAGRLQEAITLYEQTLADCERILGLDHPETLGARNNLAYTYGDAGRLDEAIILHEKTLTDRVRVLGPDHPETLASLNNIASACESAGELNLAITLFERLCVDSERIFGPDHVYTLLYRNNLAHAHGVAYTHGADRHLDTAIDLYERVLADRERILGPDHPDTLISRTDLGWLRDRRSPDQDNPDEEP